MPKYGRIENGMVMDVISAANKTALKKMYHPDIISQFVLDPNNKIKVGWSHDGTNFKAPPIPNLKPTINQIKNEARQRIEKTMPMWMVAREVSGGAAITQAIKDYAADIRTNSDVLEISLPDDYYDDLHWANPPT